MAAFPMRFALPREGQAERPVDAHSASSFTIGLMEVVALNTKDVRTAAFASRLRLLRIAYHDGLIREYLDIPPALFAALIKSEDPEKFLRDRVAGRYAAHDVRAA
jgi:hypothetical protein